MNEIRLRMHNIANRTEFSLSLILQYVIERKPFVNKFDTVRIAKQFIIGWMHEHEQYSRF